MSSSSQLGSVNSAGIATLAFTGSDEIAVVFVACFLIGAGFVTLLFSRQVKPIPVRAYERPTVS